MSELLSKVARTAQCYLPVGRDLKETVQQRLLAVTRRPHEPDLCAVRHLPPGALVLDIGANHGQSTETMLRLARVQIEAFEPNPHLSARLDERYRRRTDVSVQPFGLSDCAETLTLYVPWYRGVPFDGLASFDRDEAAGWLCGDTIYRFNPGYLELRPLKCRVRPLDSVVLGRDPYLAKLDVQGHEFRVLAGGIATLSLACPVLLLESPGRDPRIARMLAGLGYHEYEYTRGMFWQRASQAMNSFFITDGKRKEMAERGATFGS
ncbi:MAG: FkbM family methyltransferase [Dermatophilaceae bacterium]